MLCVIKVYSNKTLPLEGEYMRTWLENARKKKKLTHQQVADIAGIKRQYYGMIENGERNPSVNMAKKLGEILDVNWTLFFEGKIDKKSSELSLLRKFIT